MPSLTGVLDADFSAFVAEGKKAEATLTGMQAAAGQVQGSLTKMGDTVEPIQRVDKATKELATDTGDAATSTGGLTAKYREFDGVLAAAGINLGREVKAVEDLGAAASKGGEGLSTFTKAGLAAGAFMVGWNLGKKIDEWTGLGTAIGDATAKLLGWNTAAGGAGSGADTLARASQIAGREIRSLGEALQIIRGSIDENQAAWHRATGPAEAAKLVAKYNAEIDKLRKSGSLEALNRDLEAGIIPQKELSRLYGTSAEALGILSDRVAKHKKQVEDLNKENERFVALQDQMFGRALIAQAQEYARALDGVGNASKLLPEQMAAMNKTFIAAGEQLDRMGKMGTGLRDMYAQLAIATTDWAKVNETIGKMPDPFAVQEKARSDAYRATITQQMNLNQGITDAQLYWAHAGEIADQAMAGAAAATKETTQAVAEQKGHVDALAGSFSVLSMSADQWRAKAAGMYADAARMDTMGGTSITGWEWQYKQNLRSGAEAAMTAAGRQEALDRSVAGMQAGAGAWGGSNYSINVNAMQGIDGDQVAAELVNGMRRRGMSLG